MTDPTLPLPEGVPEPGPHPQPLPQSQQPAPPPAFGYPPPGFRVPTAAPGYPPPPGYGYPPQGYGYPPAPQNAGKAVAVLVLGIAGLVLTCSYGIGIIPAIVALALAPGAKREIRASGGQVTGEGLVKAGVICAWVAVGLGLLALVFLGIGLLVAVLSSGSFEFGP